VLLRLLLLLVVLLQQLVLHPSGAGKPCACSICI
jgi:hypothetical protein